MSQRVTPVPESPPDPPRVLCRSSPSSHGPSGKSPLHADHQTHPLNALKTRKVKDLSARRLSLVLKNTGSRWMKGFSRSSVGKESACNTGDGSIPGDGKIPRRRKWQPISVFLPGESHEQRSLAGCNSWGHKSRHD